MDIYYDIVRLGYDNGTAQPHLDAAKAALVQAMIALDSDK